MAAVSTLYVFAPDAQTIENTASEGNGSTVAAKNAAKNSPQHPYSASQDKSMLFQSDKFNHEVTDCQQNE